MTQTAQTAFNEARADAIAKARALIAKLEETPEFVNWCDVGSVQKVVSDLGELNRFYNA